MLFWLAVMGILYYALVQSKAAIHSTRDRDTFLCLSQCLFTCCWTLLRTRGRSWRWGIKTLSVCSSKFWSGMTRSCWCWWFHSSKNCPSSWRTRTTWWVKEKCSRVPPAVRLDRCSWKVCIKMCYSLWYPSNNFYIHKSGFTHSHTFTLTPTCWFRGNWGLKGPCYDHL